MRYIDYIEERLFVCLIADIRLVFLCVILIV